MLKKIVRGANLFLNIFKRRMESTWNRMSRGAQQISRIITFPRGENWRRQDKHQKNHDSRPHKSHRYK